MKKNKLNCVFISDTHQTFPSDVPDGDVLFHTGDITYTGSPAALKAFNEWLGTLPHKHKVVIAGNHDLTLENNDNYAKELLSNATYLNNSNIEINGFKIWGSPITPTFGDWAFMKQRGSQELKDIWKQIPLDTDILLTHGPPYGILDMNKGFIHCGCEELLKAVDRVRPKIHAFGHLHEARGVKKIGKTQFINSSIMDERYDPVYKPIQIVITK